MDIFVAIEALGALAQQTRLSALQLLIMHSEGMPAGDIARELGVPQNTMSVHLAKLAHAGLIHSERRSRHIFYRADQKRLSDLVFYLQTECCGNSTATTTAASKRFPK